MEAIGILGVETGRLAIEPDLGRRREMAYCELGRATRRRVDVGMGIGRLLLELPVEEDEIDVVVLAGAFIGVMRALGVDRGMQRLPGQGPGLVAVVRPEPRLIGDEGLVDVLIRQVRREGTEHQPILDDAELEPLCVAGCALRLRLAGLVGGIGDGAAGHPPGPGHRRVGAGIQSAAIATPADRALRGRQGARGSQRGVGLGRGFRSHRDDACGSHHGAQRCGQDRGLCESDQLHGVASFEGERRDLGRGGAGGGEGHGSIGGSGDEAGWNIGCGQADQAGEQGGGG